MKTIRNLSLVAITVLAILPAKADVTINLGVSKLYKADGTTLVPDGALIQLVASTTDTTFTAPTAASFTGNSSDDVVLASFSLDSSTYGPGSFIKALPVTLSGNLTTGDQLILRWFPTLTTLSSSPGAGTIFGQYRTDATLDGSEGAWVLPADGTPYSLVFQTISAGGSVANSAGAASLVTAVPEPSSYGLLGAAALAGVVVRRRRRG